MGTRKNLTIGVTVNLEHYENLRIEVSGEVDSAADAGELAGFLDEVLGRFGRGDPATAERVDSYRKRVLPACEPPSGGGDAEGRGGSASSGDTGGVLAVPGKEPVRAPVARSPAAAPGVPVQAGTTGETAACEVCGGTVTPAEQKMSRLFTGRTLCRACLRNL